MVNEIRTKMRTMYWKSKIASIGRNFWCDRNLSVSYPQRVTIGDDCHINENVLMNAKCGIEIGNFASYAKIISTQYDIEKWVNNERVHIGGKVYIGDHTWKCTGVTILPS